MGWHRNGRDLSDLRDFAHSHHPQPTLLLQATCESALPNGQLCGSYGAEASTRSCSFSRREHSHVDLGHRERSHPISHDLVSAARCSGRHTDLYVCCALCGYNGSFFKICTTSGHFFKLSETIVVAQVDSHFTRLQGTSFCTAIHSSWGKTTTTTSSRGRDSPRLEDGNSAQTLTVTRELMSFRQRSRHTFDFRTTFLA